MEGMQVIEEGRRTFRTRCDVIVGEVYKFRRLVWSLQHLRLEDIHIIHCIASIDLVVTHLELQGGLRHDRVTHKDHLRSLTCIFFPTR